MEFCYFNRFSFFSIEKEEGICRSIDKVFKEDLLIVNFLSQVWELFLKYSKDIKQKIEVM